MFFRRRIYIPRRWKLQNGILPQVPRIHGTAGSAVGQPSLPKIKKLFIFLKHGMSNSQASFYIKKKYRRFSIWKSENLKSVEFSKKFYKKIFQNFCYVKGWKGIVVNRAHHLNQVHSPFMANIVMAYDLFS